MLSELPKIALLVTVRNVGQSNGKIYIFFKNRKRNFTVCIFLKTNHITIIDLILIVLYRSHFEDVIRKKVVF